MCLYICFWNDWLNFIEVCVENNDIIGLIAILPSVITPIMISHFITDDVSFEIAESISDFEINALYTPIKDNTIFITIVNLSAH